MIYRGITYDTYTQENIMSENKSGFQIRADLLGQAQGIIEENIRRTNEAVYLHNDNHPDDKRSLVTTQITAQDVISVAQELNSFVNQK